MNTGKIAAQAFYRETLSPYVYLPAWIRVEDAVIAAYRERETVEGWRLLDVGEMRQLSDKVYWPPLDRWETYSQDIHPDATQRKTSLQCRRRARFLREATGDVAIKQWPDATVINCEAGVMSCPPDQLHTAYDALKHISGLKREVAGLRAELEKEKANQENLFSKVRDKNALIEQINSHNRELRKELAQTHNQKEV